MSITNQPDVTYMNKYINDGHSAVVSLNNLYEKITVTDKNGIKLFKVPFNDFFIKYNDQLKEIVQYHTVTQTMFYKPKMMSLELYGTTELWLALLRLNGMRNVTEFHYPVIQIYNPGDLFELINIFFKREGIK